LRKKPWVACPSLEADTSGFKWAESMNQVKSGFALLGARKPYAEHGADMAQKKKKQPADKSIGMCM
jgi:hypothetical protein